VNLVGFMTYTIAVCTVKTSYDGQRNCLKHVEFYSKKKFEKLVHLVGFIIRIYDDARSPERHLFFYLNIFQLVYIYAQHVRIQNLVYYSYSMGWICTHVNYSYNKTN